jgi:Fe-S oxidoreductase
MGILDEPRYVINATTNNFVEMPENTIRESTFCCAGGAGLGNEENMEMRLRGGLPRGAALRYVHEKYDVNTLACICAIDKATLIPLCDYWVPGPPMTVEVAGVDELLGNALVMEGEKKRTVGLRGEPLANVEEEAEETEGGDNV